MTQTLETLAERLTRLEKNVTEMTLQMSELVDASLVGVQPDFHISDKLTEAEVLQKMREQLGITDIQLMPLEELRKSMVQHGIRAEDNEFSRAIIKIVRDKCVLFLQGLFCFNPETDSQQILTNWVTTSGLSSLKM